MASTDTTASLALIGMAHDPSFQDRCYLRFLNSAISVTTEATTITSHVQRLAFAGALFAGSVSKGMLALVVLANPTNRTNALSDTAVAGGAILDSDIDFQVNSVLTGIATSRSW